MYWQFSHKKRSSWAKNYPFGEYQATFGRDGLSRDRMNRKKYWPKQTKGAWIGKKERKGRRRRRRTIDKKKTVNRTLRT